MSCGLADYGGFRHLGMRHQRRLDLHGAKTVSGDVQHVVDASHDPVVAIRIAMRESPAT
jgi:hypothetical protein